VADAYPGGSNSCAQPGSGEDPSPLPCQIPNNSNAKLSAAGKRTQFALEFIVQQLIQRYGVERVGFLTLTFADHVLDPVEASRRYNSLRTGVLSKRYAEVVKVFERQKSGRIHYHLLVVCEGDIRRGFDFAAVKRREYGTVGWRLKAEWAFWRATAKKYRFGRCELKPIQKPEAMGRYVGKYTAKHTAHRKECDKRVRLVACSREARVATTAFAWASGRARCWRAGVPRLIALLAEVGELPSVQEANPDIAQGLISKYFGKHWRWRFRNTIAALGENESAQVADDFWREVNREWEKVLDS
jgi:hypothetical protein